MQSTSRHGLRHLARRAPQLGRRHASGGHAHEHAAPVNESFGKGFYLSLSLVPFSYALWTFSRPDSEGKPTSLTALITKWSSWREEWERRNSLHTAMVEQAGHDRNLFINSPGPKHIDMRFPEMLGNTGSPHNVHAGIKPDKSAVTEFLLNKQRESEAEKLKNLGW